MIIPVSLLLGSVSLDLVSLYCIKRSKGFKRVTWGVAGAGTGRIPWAQWT